MPFESTPNPILEINSKVPSNSPTGSFLPTKAGENKEPTTGDASEVSKAVVSDDEDKSEDGTRFDFQNIVIASTLILLAITVTMLILVAKRRRRNAAEEAKRHPSIVLSPTDDSYIVEDEGSASKEGDFDRHKAENDEGSSDVQESHASNTVLENAKSTEVSPDESRSVDQVAKHIISPSYIESRCTDDRLISPNSVSEFVESKVGEDDFSSSSASNYSDGRWQPFARTMPRSDTWRMDSTLEFASGDDGDADISQDVARPWWSLFGASGKDQEDDAPPSLEPSISGESGAGSEYLPDNAWDFGDAEVDGSVSSGDGFNHIKGRQLSSKKEFEVV